MNGDLNINDIGLELEKTYINRTRVGKVDNVWLVEYRRKPKWFFDRWWWFNDGKYVDYREAVNRAKFLAETGYVTKLVTSKPVFDVVEESSDTTDELLLTTPVQSQVIRKVVKKVVRPAPANWTNPQDLDGDGDIDEDDYRLY